MTFTAHISLNSSWNEKCFQENVVEKTKTHILCQETFLFIFENHTFYGMMWENIVVPGRPQTATWRMRIVR
jgi:hypothetical protein